MKIPIKFKTKPPSRLIALGLALACFGLLPTAQATDLDSALPNGNTADGAGALVSLTFGSWNSAFGFEALNKDTTGSTNTATGLRALFNNVQGNANTANGVMALFNSTNGVSNTAIGAQSLLNKTSGNLNIALGYRAGASVGSGSNNIIIGNQGANESNTIRIGTNASHTRTFIAGIKDVVINLGDPVYINSAGQMGSVLSSQRYKADIKPMDNASEAIFALKPVTFRYKQEFDPKGVPQFGLVAEEVAKVTPDLVVPDAEGKPRSVRYEAINAMLLNEFLKQHRKMQEQAATIADLRSTVARQEVIIAQQQKGMEAVTARLDQQAAQIQKVSAQIEVGKPSPQTVLNNR
jgi:uncharacterized coiled-coil protein SlyX